MVCWMDESPLRAGARLHLKHTSRWTCESSPGRVPARREHARRIGDVAGLELNDIGRVDLRLGVPLFFDDYRRNGANGELHPRLDEATSLTCRRRHDHRPVGLVRPGRARGAAPLDHARRVARSGLKARAAPNRGPRPNRSGR